MNRYRGMRFAAKKIINKKVEKVSDKNKILSSFIRLAPISPQCQYLPIDNLTNFNHCVFRIQRN